MGKMLKSRRSANISGSLYNTNTTNHTVTRRIFTQSRNEDIQILKSKFKFQAQTVRAYVACY